MRIVGRKEFLAMPEGTIYQGFTPNMFSDLEVKHQTIFLKGEAKDYIYANLTADFETPEGKDLHDVLFDAVDKGITVPISFEETARSGLYDDGLYAVWDKEDVQGLIDKLKECLDVAPVRTM